MKPEAPHERYTVWGLEAVNYCFSKLAGFMHVAHLHSDSIVGATSMRYYGWYMRRLSSTAAENLSPVSLKPPAWCVVDVVLCDEREPEGVYVQALLLENNWLSD